MVGGFVPLNGKDSCVFSHSQPSTGLRSASRTGRLATVLTAVAALSLAGCASSGSQKSSSTSATGSSDLASITVTGGDAKTAPSIKIAKEPFTVTKTEVRELKAGTGAALTDKDIASVDIAVFNATNGQKENSTYEGTPASIYLGQTDLRAGLKKGLTGQRSGGRVVVAGPPAEGFGTTGNSALKIGPDDTMLFVIDTISATQMLTEATGKAVAPKKGLPTVKVTPGAAATITIPAKTKPPTSLVVQPLIKGSGAKVVAGQGVRVTYTGVLWRNGEKFDSSFDHDPKYFEFPVGAGKVIKAWDEGIVGQTVGSRLLLVVPPAYGYGATGSAPKIKGTDTLVFVVDILGAY